MSNRATLKSTDSGEQITFDVVEEETMEISNEVTEHAIEDGAVVADHVTLQPYVLSVDGVLVGEAADDAIDKFLDWIPRDNKAHMLYYSGRNTIGRMVLRDLRRDYTVSNADGYGFTLTLQRVDITTPEIVEVDVEVEIEQKEEKDKGRQQTQSKDVSPSPSPPDPAPEPEPEEEEEDLSHYPPHVREGPAEEEEDLSHLPPHVQ